MRIVAGTFGGRRLETPKNNDIRPTSDKIRGAIFNALLSRIDLEGAKILDLFSGTGALGLEALSRGATHCTFLDKNKTSLELCRSNIKTLGAQSISETILRDSSKSLSNLPHAQYDLIFLDPPYNKGLIEQTLSTILNAKLCHNDTVLVLESEKNWTHPSDTFQVLSEKTYGDTKIIITKL